MISRTVRLYPTKAQAARLDEWFVIGTGVWNWALGQYVNAGPVRPTEFSLINATAGHATRVGFSSQALHGIIRDVSRSWREFRSGARGKPNWKGQRNRLSSIPFKQNVSVNGRSVRVPILGPVKARGLRGLPDARVLTCRLMRRPRGWYFCLVLDAEPKAVPLVSDGAVGIDLGYSTLATLSNGEKIEHPNEYRRAAKRLACAQRSRSKKRQGRVQQSIALMRRTRNHEISRQLVSRFSTIYVSRDNIRGLARTFGKSVLNAGHGELLEMLASKSRQAGRVYLEVPSRCSTKTCGDCGALTGPTGFAGLKVREWGCSACGAVHDRDINAARVTLLSGAVLALEMRREAQSEISGQR